MRRRNLLGRGSIEYVFSTLEPSVSVGDSSSYKNVNITSTANGSNIGYSVVSYDGTVVANATTAATYVTIYYSKNSTYELRSGYVVLKQNDSNKTITINVSQNAQPISINYDAILLKGFSGSDGSIYFDSKGSSVSFFGVPSWATVTYSNSYISVTATSENSDSKARSGIIGASIGGQSINLTLIQLPSDYFSRDYVSIGGVNWAIKNVGASSVRDYGNYYMYGKGSRVYNSSDSAYEGTENPLASSADTATQVMGEGWRMPTKDEITILKNTSSYWVDYEGAKKGIVFISSGEVLFLPASGYYVNGGLNKRGEDGFVWSSTPSDNGNAYQLHFDNRRYKYVSRSYGRVCGFSVRGVHV